MRTENHLNQSTSFGNFLEGQDDSDCHTFMLPHSPRPASRDAPEPSAEL